MALQTKSLHVVFGAAGFGFDSGLSFNNTDCMTQRASTPADKSPALH